MPPTQKVQQKSKVKVSNAVKLDAKNPVPFEYGGSAFTTVDGAKYVPFLGSDDNFFKTLLEARLLSVTQNACITTKRDYSVGEGWYITNLTDNQKAEVAFTDWAKSINNKNESLTKIFTKIFGSFFTFGNVFIEVVRGTAGGKKFIKVYVHSCLECRLTQPNQDDICTAVIKSKKFKENGIWMGTGKIVTIPIYNPLQPTKSWLKEGPVERTMIHIKNEYEGYEYYGIPSNVSGLPQQVLEYETVRYNLDNLDNNMKPGGLIILQGNVTQDEANKLGRNVISQHTGKGKRGRWLVMASEQGIENSKVEQFNTQQEGSFIETDKRAEEKIIFANQWDGLLAGLQNASAMGKGNSFILSVFRMKYQTVIKPAQTFIIEEFLKPVLAIADAFMSTKWSTYEFGLMTNTPVSILENNTTIDTWTVDEVRKEAGLPMLDGDKGKMLVGELKKGNQNNYVQGQPTTA